MAAEARPPPRIRHTTPCPASSCTLPGAAQIDRPARRQWVETKRAQAVAFDLGRAIKMVNVGQVRCRDSLGWAGKVQSRCVVSKHGPKCGLACLLDMPAAAAAARNICCFRATRLQRACRVQLLSKWVGESQKNIDAVFEEAKQLDAVVRLKTRQAPAPSPSTHDLALCRALSRAARVRRSGGAVRHAWRRRQRWCKSARHDQRWRPSASLGELFGNGEGACMHARCWHYRAHPRARTRAHRMHGDDSIAPHRGQTQG